MAGRLTNGRLRRILAEDLKHHREMAENYAKVKPQHGKEVAEGVIKQRNFHLDAAEALEEILAGPIGDERFNS